MKEPSGEGWQCLVQNIEGVKLEEEGQAKPLAFSEL